jgi:uncharacterized membrane protein
MPRVYVWIMAIAFLVIGMALTVGPGVEARETRRLEEAGERTMATVVDEFVTDRGRRLGTEIRLAVEFSDEFGIPYDATIKYCGEPGDKVPGDEVEIVYDPESLEIIDDPNKTPLVRYTGCGFIKEPLLLMSFGGVALVVGTVLVLWVWKGSGWKRRRIGIVLVVIGLFTGAASFSENCDCQELVYTSAAVVVIGAVPMIAGRPKKDDNFIIAER